MIPRLDLAEPPTRAEWTAWGYADYAFYPSASVLDQEFDAVVFQRTPVEPAGLKHYLGFELEVEWPDNADDDAWKRAVLWGVKRRHPWCKIVYDCSLHHGFEIVSQPMSYRFFRQELPALQDTLAALRQAGCSSYDPGSCGLHVHQSRAAFTDAQLFRFELFLARNKRFVRRVSQRTQQKLDMWAHIGPRRWELEASASDNTLEYLRKKARGELSMEDYDSKATAVVLSEEHDTVELRVMRGSLKGQSFAKGVEFAVALYRFAARTPTNQLTDQAFMDWVATRAHQFPNLHNFLAARRPTLLQQAA